MIIIKNERGITLVALVITIVVIIILGSVAVKVGIESIEHSQMISFVSKMQLIQKKVDFLAENGGYESLGENVYELSEEQKNKIIQSIEAENIDDQKWSRLPSIYQEVEYIESTGTQYINTGIVADDSTGVYVDHTICADNSRDNAIIGSRENSGNSRFFIDMDWGNTDTIGWGFNTYSSTDKRYSISGKTNERIQTTFNYKNNRVCKVNNVEIDNLSTRGALAEQTNPLMIFCCSNDDQLSYFTACKVYSLKISKGLDDIRNFIPCYRKSDNKPGMYDLVGNKFYTNQDTGDDFIVGPDAAITLNTSIRLSVNKNSIPLLYHPVEYIQSSGTQYIMTNIVPSNNMGIYAKIASLNTSNDSLYIGSKQGDNIRTFFGNNNNKLYFGWDTSLTSSNRRPSVTNRKINIIEMNFLNSRNSILNNTIIESNIKALGGNSYPITIFAGNYSGTISYNSSIRLYELKISRGTNIKNYFIPCYRISDNKPGLYDLIEDTFYTNQGTGEFEVGPDMYISTINTSNGNPIRYFDSTAIAEDLGLENIDDEIVVNFETREVISLSGINYAGEIYYSQYRLPGGQTVKQNTTENLRQIGWEDFTITPNINGLNATFTISGIRFTNGTLSYSNDSQNTWTEITNYTVANETVTTENLTKSGRYYFKWTDNTNKNNEYILDTVSIRLTNSPQLKGNLGDLSTTYNYTALDSATWAYATDNNETELDETDDTIYVWIPRYAYETEEKTNIEFLRGTSNVTTKDTYIPETGWTIPEVFKDVTGVWVDVTDEYNTDELDTLDIIDILDGATIL